MLNWIGQLVAKGRHMLQLDYGNQLGNSEVARTRKQEREDPGDD